MAYDVSLKRRGVGWMAFTVAFPTLLLYAWTGAGGGLPPGWPVLLPLAALAGPALHLANALTDLDLDRMAGGDGLAVRLGRRRSVQVLMLLTMVVYLLAWGLLWSIEAPAAAVVIAAGATIMATVGVAATARATRRSTAWGWSLQALAIAGLAAAWVMAHAP